MKITHITALALVVASFMSHGAFAQDADARARSASASQAIVGIDSQSIAGAYVDNRSAIPARTTQRAVGDATLRTAPSVQAPSMGSGHPCGLGNSLGFSIIGGGATAGATRVDDACLLAQMGHTTAATVMIAARNESACRALVATGQISNASYCGNGTTTKPGVYARVSSGGAETDAINVADKVGVDINLPNIRPRLRPNAGNVAPELAAASSRSPVCYIKPGHTRTIIATPGTERDCARQLGF